MSKSNNNGNLTPRQQFIQDWSNRRHAEGAARRPIHLSGDIQEARGQQAARKQRHAEHEVKPHEVAKRYRRGGAGQTAAQQTKSRTGQPSGTATDKTVKQQAAGAEARKATAAKYSRSQGTEAGQQATQGSSGQNAAQGSRGQGGTGGRGGSGQGGGGGGGRGGGGRGR